MTDRIQTAKDWLKSKRKLETTINDLSVLATLERGQPFAPRMPSMISASMTGNSPG